MPLANIAMKPTDATQQSFDFSHYQDHLEIVQAINAQHGTHLPTYIINPVPTQDDAWKRLHQSFHDDMAKVLNVSNSDLTGDMDGNWYEQNYRAHTAARAILGI